MEQLKTIWNKRNIGSLALKLLSFLLILILLDFAAGKTLAHFYSKQISGWEYTTKYSIEDTKQELLIFGASRAQEQYIPVCFEDSLKVTAYNVGKSGMSMPYHYGIFTSIYNRYTPKIIILDFENLEFLKTEKSYETLSSLLPFYTTHPELQPILQLRGPFEKYKMLSATYPFNSLIFKIIVGNTKLNQKGSEQNKGYNPLTRKLKQPIHQVNFSTTYEIDTIKVNMYTAIIEACKKRDIKLFVVCSPYYILQTGTDISMEMAKAIAAKNNVDFLDYSQRDTFLKNPEFFDDTVHVNTSGADIFSKMVASDIKKKLGVK